MRCLLVEDEPLAADRLESFVKRLPELQWLGVMPSAEAALPRLVQGDVELLFLDLNLGGLHGLDLLEVAAPKCPVIVTTADASQALRAFELRVCDYLHKPYGFARFVQAVERARGQLPMLPAPDAMFVKVGSEWRRLRLQDLLFIEGDKDYRCLHLRDGGQWLTLQTFAAFEQRWSPRPLCRIHRSFMVNLDAVQSVSSDRVRLGPSSARRELPVSSGQRDALFALLR